MANREPIAVIVGGGFAGLSAAKALSRAPARVVLIDRTNHHLFQPLLYQDSPDRDRAEVHYDYLILATGATYSYFGHQEFAQYAPGLKSLADADAIRNKILRAARSA